MEISLAEIEELRRDERELGKRLAGLSREHFHAVTKYWEKAQALLEEAKALKEKQKEVEYKDMATKIKFSRKAGAFVAEVKRFQQELIKQFEAGRLSEKEGRVLGTGSDKIVHLKLEEAERELAKLGWLAELKVAEAELEKRKQLLRQNLEKREQELGKNLEHLLTAKRKGPPDEEKINLQARLGQEWAAFSEWREKMLGEWAKKPLLELLKPYFSQPLLAKAGFPVAGREQAAEELLAFLQAERKLAGKNAAELFALANLSRAKLAHEMDNPEKFVRLLQENHVWLGCIEKLPRSNFLQLNLADGEGTANLIAFLRTAKQERFVPFLEEMKELGLGGWKALEKESEWKKEWSQLRQENEKVLEKERGEIGKMLQLLKED